jgi:hypothetical protein
MGCVLLTMHTLAASAGPITINPGVLTATCDVTPCIGKITIQQSCTAEDGMYADFLFKTSIDASIFLGASTDAPNSTVYYNEFAHVEAAAMQLFPAQQHGVRLRNLNQNTTYHYALIAAVDAQHKSRVEGTFKTGQLIDGCGGPGWHGNPVSE